MRTSRRFGLRCSSGRCYIQNSTLSVTRGTSTSTEGCGHKLACPPLISLRHGPHVGRQRTVAPGPDRLPLHPPGRRPPRWPGVPQSEPQRGRRRMLLPHRHPLLLRASHNPWTTTGLAAERFPSRYGRHSWAATYADGRSTWSQAMPLRRDGTTATCPPRFCATFSKN